MTHFHDTYHESAFSSMVKRVRWIKLISREGVDIATISALDVVFYACVRQVEKSIKEPFFTFFKDRILTHYLRADAVEVGRRIYPHYFKTPAKVKMHYKNGLKFLAKVKKSTRFWQYYPKRRDYSWQLPALREFRKQFTYVNYEYSIWSWWGIESWQIDAEHAISEMIKRNHLEDRQDQLLVSIYKPWKKTAIIHLQERLQKGEPVARLMRDYQFLRSWSAVWYRPIDKKWIVDFRLQSKEGAKMELLSLAEIIKLLRPNRKERWFLEIAPYIIFFKDWRDDVRRMHVYAWSFLFDSIAKRFGVERNDLGYLSFDEIELALKTGRFTVRNVLRRKPHPCVITARDEDSTMQVIDRDIQKYQRIVASVQAENAKQTEVQGLVAQPGRIRGIVRVVKTYHDVKKFNKDEILVANTTHPNYLPAMQKAAAFVTNEGGIVSHAAIVARELKIPCIVGTKVATQVFDDGDWVEVDATRGVVRKLSINSLPLG